MEATVVVFHLTFGNPGKYKLTIAIERVDVSVDTESNAISNDFQIDGSSLDHVDHLKEIKSFYHE